jgi:hypothetical protein
MGKTFGLGKLAFLTAVAPAAVSLVGCTVTHDPVTGVLRIEGRSEPLHEGDYQRVEIGGAVLPQQPHLLRAV